MTENAVIIDHDYTEILDQIKETLDDTYTIIEDTQHPLLDTPFSEYTVTEGLLLILVISIVFVCIVKIVKWGFSWLL